MLTDREQFGLKIRKQRMAKGMSLDALSKLINCPKSTLHHWEQGDATPRYPEKVQRLKKVLGIQ